MSAAEGQKFAAMTVKTLKSVRTDENLSILGKSTNQLQVESTSLARKQRAPKRNESTGNEVVFPEQVEDYYCPILFEVIDRIANGIEMRFDQPGFQIRECFTFKAANKEAYDDEI